MTRATASPADVAKLASTPSGGLDGYWQQSELPWPSLVFLLPLIVVYEVGTLFFTEAARTGSDQQIIAFTLLRRFFDFCGAHGRHLPAFSVLVILLAWHIVRADPWTVRLRTLAGMVFESVTLVVPLLVMGFALSHYLPLGAIAGRTQDDLIFSIGAGIYEELVFRLILFTYLSLILRDAFQMSPMTCGLLMVVISAVLFSLYHYLSPYEGFQVHSFTFRTLAGIYFGVIFLTRGFGITAGVHAAYDVLIVALAAARS